MSSKKMRKKASIGSEDIEWLNQVAWVALDDRAEINERKLAILSTLLLSVKEQLKSRNNLEAVKCLETIEKNLTIGLNSEDLSSDRYSMLVRIADELIPQAAKSYLALKHTSSSSYFEKGKSGEELFVQQIEVLNTTLESLIQNSNVEDLRALEIQNRYIKELFTQE
jgi:hypothetical protein